LIAQWSNAEHESLLQRLWAAWSSPASTAGTPQPFPGHKHELWKSIGFQGSDPVTDFRGMGYLGLHVRAALSLGCDVLCCAVLCCAVLCCAVLC
jgi:hypothetical protein